MSTWDGAFNSVNFLVFSGITLVELLFECLKFVSLSPVRAARIRIEILTKKGFLKFVTFVFCRKDQMSKPNECMSVSRRYNALGTFNFSLKIFVFVFFLVVLATKLVFFHWRICIINCANKKKLKQCLPGWSFQAC